MIVQLRLLAMTAILTVLIWVSADSLVTEVATIAVSFRASPATNMLVQLNSPVDRHEVQVSGPRRTVEAVKGRGTYSVRLPIDDRPTGEAVLPLDRFLLKREMSEQWSEFRRLSVVSIEPNMLPIIVDHMTNVEVEVAAKRLTLSYEVEPQLQRSSVSVRMRDSVIQTWPTGQPLNIDVSQELERLLKDQPVGKSVTLRVGLDARRFGADAEISPNAIEMTATVRAQRTAQRIPTVPILVAMSFTGLDRPVRAVARDGSPVTLVTQAITVTGLTDDVMRLVRGETRAYGIIHIKEDDFQEMGVLKLAVPEFHLPKGVELAGDVAPIEFQLLPRSTTSSPP